MLSTVILILFVFALALSIVSYFMSTDRWQRVLSIAMILVIAVLIYLRIA